MTVHFEIMLWGARKLGEGKFLWAFHFLISWKSNCDKSIHGISNDFHLRFSNFKTRMGK